MTDAGFFRGTSTDQDNRFANKQKKLLKGINFSPILNTKLNMSKIDLDNLKPWIEAKIKDILEKEDELLSESIYEHLTEKEPDGKNILVLVTGFVDEVKASKFMEELWTKLIDLQDNSNGVSKASSVCPSSEPKPKDDISDDTTTATTTTATIAKPDGINENANDPKKGDSRGTNEQPEQDATRSSKSSHSMTPPSRSVSKSPGSHRLHDRSRGRQRRRPQDDELSRDGSNQPTQEGKKSRSRSPSASRSPSVSRKSSKKSGDEMRRRSRFRSSSRSRRSGSRSVSRSRSRTRSPSRSRSRSGSRSRSYSKSRSVSRSPKNRSRSPYGHSYRGRRSRSRSRGFAPRSRSPRGRRFWPNSGRGSYRGNPHHTSYGGFNDRRRGAMGPMRRRSPWGRRRYSPRSPPRRRRSPSFSPRRRRSPSSPYQRRSRSRTPPIHVNSGRGLHSPRSHAPEHLDMLGGRHVPIHHDMHRSMLPASRSPRGHLNHRTYGEGQLLPRHSPSLASNKAPLELPSASHSSLAGQTGPPPSPDRYSPLSSTRKKHKKDKKHRKHKKSKKHHSESPEKKKKHKKHKKTKKHKSH